ncbi:MAG: GTPase domain-containing protein [Desulfuromonadales bacterium]|nr:GTPase domain-containing protein [Desulfuromonadales bacterium]
MPLVNHVKKEIHAKIVYYGPEGVGKSTSLRYVFSRIRPHLRGELKSVPATGSSSLFFDFSPFEQPLFGGYRLRLHLYTLQGRVVNPAAWKMILKGIDGLMIVSDASPGGILSDQQSLTQLRDLIGSYGVSLDGIPTVLQLNKYDLPARISVENAARELGLESCRACSTSALNGKGVLETLTALSHLVIGRIAERDDVPRDRTADADVRTGETALEDVPTPVAGSNDEVFWNVSRGDKHHQSVSSEDSFRSTTGEVSVADDGVRVEGGTVMIPLDILTPSGGRQRFVVTVVVALDEKR